MRVICTALFLLVGVNASNAQVVEGVGYFLSISDVTDKGVRTVTPGRGIQSGKPIQLGQLPWRTDTDTGSRRRTVYAAATLTSPTIPSQIIFLFRRVVDSADSRCEAEKDQIVISDEDVAELKSSGIGRDAAAISSILFGKTAQILGGSEIGIGNVKAKVMTTEPGLRTYYDFRFVHCPGQVQVWVTDDQGQILGPSDRNRGIGLTITE